MSEAMATNRQLDLLQALTGKDWQGLGLTKKAASELLSKLLDAKREYGEGAAQEAGQAAHAQQVEARFGAEPGQGQGGEPVSQGNSDGDGGSMSDTDGTQDQGKQAQDKQAQGPSTDPLGDAVVETVRRRRDEVLDGLDLQAPAQVARKVVELRISDGTKRDLDGLMHYMMPKLLQVAAEGDHCMLVGPAGTGKTESARQVAKALEREYSYWACSPRTTAAALLGMVNAHGDYVPSLFRKAYEFGHVFVLDEADNAAADLLVTLNGALANGEAAFPDAVVPRHPDFVVIATANTYGKGANRIYAGRQPLDGATLDRFVFLDWGYDEELEQALAPSDDWTEYVQSVRKVVLDQRIREVVSMRASMTGGKYLGLGWSWAEVEQSMLYKGWNADSLEKVQAVRGAYTETAARYPGQKGGA
jgi:hypothetical protein